MSAERGVATIGIFVCALYIYNLPCVCVCGGGVFTLVVNCPDLELHAQSRYLLVTAHPSSDSVLEILLCTQIVFLSILNYTTLFSRKKSVPSSLV